MFRFLFSLIPWWLFAIFALTFAPLTIEFYEIYRADQDRVKTALAVGPPPVTATQSFNPSRSPWPFGEVRLNGVMRADVGILTVYFGETEYRYVVMDDSGEGSVVAILSTAAKSEDTITRLVEAADSEGRVTVQGFLAPARAGEISRRLAVRGYTTGEVFVVEPFFGTRDAALAGKIEESKWIFYVAFGFTAFFALMAVWRFSRWRKRRALRRPAKAARPAANQSEPTRPGKQPTRTAQPVSNAGSPWDTFRPQDSNVAPQTSGSRKAAPGQPLPKPQTAKSPKRAPQEPAVTAPEFESVFPGGGSGFRFKTADEIIRQSFGTLSSLNKVNRDDP